MLLLGQRDVAELHNAQLGRLIATQCCRLSAASLCLSLTHSTHTDKTDARDEYVISLQTPARHTFSLVQTALLD